MAESVEAAGYLKGRLADPKSYARRSTLRSSCAIILLVLSTSVPLTLSAAQTGTDPLQAGNGTEPTLPANPSGTSPSPDSSSVEPLEGLGGTATHGLVTSFEPEDEEPKLNEAEPADLRGDLSFGEIADPQIASTLLTLVAAFVGFWAALLVDRYRAGVEERRRFSAAITSAGNELEFYVAKLKYLSDQLGALVNAFESPNNGRLVLPSYTLYPSFLEQAKNRLAEFMRQPELVKEVGHCHFELGHVVKRLDRLQTSRPMRNDEYRSNLLNFKGLVDQTTGEFERVATMINRSLKGKSI